MKNIRDIYYLNINYICNNNCKFCLSPSTYSKKQKMKLKDIIMFSDIKESFSNSRVIINGGEPTLYNDLHTVIGVFNGKGAEVVLYSNGRKFSDIDYTKLILSNGVSRITIPIHGDKQLHNSITQKCCYDETILGIKNIIKIKKRYNTELEVKIITTDELISKNINIFQILDKEKIIVDSIDTLVISGVIKSKIFDLNNLIVPESKALSKFVSELILKTHLNRINVKLEDIPLCILPKSLISDINANNIKTKCKYVNFYFFDSKYSEGKLINYDKDTIYKSECKNCNLNKCCGSIMNRYYILEMDKQGVWWRTLE